MKKGWKIFWIIVLVLFLIIAGFVGLTIYQGVKLAKTVEANKNLQSDIQAIANGDCSKLPELEAKFPELKSQMQGACANPALRALIQQQAPSGVDMCAEVNNPNNQLWSSIDKIKADCVNKTK